MAASRKEYLSDLLRDCAWVVRDYPEEDRPVLIAALVLTDSVNGLRKTLLQINGGTPPKTDA